jgi:NifU-like protein involved in Fe-S cluster formation
MTGLTIQNHVEKNMDEAKAVLKKLETLWMGAASGPFSDRVLELAYEPERMGGMDDADAAGRVTDDCGDVLEIFLKARSGIILDASFLCDGCGASLACGSAAAQLVCGQTVEGARGIDSKAILEFLGGLPESHRHTAEDWSAALAEALGKMK